MGSKVMLAMVGTVDEDALHQLLVDYYSRLEKAYILLDGFVV